MVIKVCIKCHHEKPIELFTRNQRRKDGHEGRCKECAVNNTREWRKRYPGGPSANRRHRYERELETGARSRKQTQAEISAAAASIPVEVKHKRRLVNALRYTHKRLSQTVAQSRFDKIVIDEVLVTCQQLKEQTGHDWHIDHIVPLNHRVACGLHNAFNVQPAPASWNTKKRNRTMEVYAPMVPLMHDIIKRASIRTTA